MVLTKKKENIIKRLNTYEVGFWVAMFIIATLITWTNGSVAKIKMDIIDYPNFIENIEENLKIHKEKIHYGH